MWKKTLKYIAVAAYFSPTILAIGSYPCRKLGTRVYRTKEEEALWTSGKFHERFPPSKFTYPAHEFNSNVFMLAFLNINPLVVPFLLATVMEPSNWKNYPPRAKMIGTPRNYNWDWDEWIHSPPGTPQSDAEAAELARFWPWQDAVGLCGMWRPFLEVKEN